MMVGLTRGFAGRVYRASYELTSQAPECMVAGVMANPKSKGERRALSSADRAERKALIRSAGFHSHRAFLGVPVVQRRSSRLADVVEHRQVAAAPRPTKPPADAVPAAPPRLAAGG